MNSSSRTNNFYANDTNTAFIKYDGSIKNEEDFLSISPYSTKGKRSSPRIWRDEIGDKKKLDGQYKTYNGKKPYIIQRLAYNKFRKSQNLPMTWQQYDDFSSHDEAFERSNDLFHGRRTLSKNDMGKNRSTRKTKTRKSNDNNSGFNTGGSQINFETDDRESREDKRGQNEIDFEGVEIVDLPEHNDLMFKKYINNKDSMKKEIDSSGKILLSYPNSDIYWKCPATNMINFKSIRDQIENYKKQHNNNLNHLKGKKIYCGKELNDYIRLKLCAQHIKDNDDRDNDNEEKDEDEQEQEHESEMKENPAMARSRAIKEGLDAIEREYPELKNLEQFGSPGQCFQFGKIYKTPLKHSFMFFTT